MIYFTSDNHFGCQSTFETRPHFSDIEEMDATMIENWNEVVKDDDTVYILGDFSYDTAPPNKVKHYLRQLNGEKILIMGNHDFIISSKSETDDYTSIMPYCELECNEDPYDPPVKLVLFHYPIEFWHDRGRNAIHLHGHMHSSHMYNVHNLISKVRKYDVGVDANNYTPISLNKIFTLMNTNTSHLSMEFFNSLT